MLGPIVIPADYEAWNRKWHAPNGRPLPGRASRIPDLGGWQSRYRGPFAFQPNNATRRFEYPWAYHAVPLRAGMAVVDLGGGLSGFQFTLARSGPTVTNVDPFVDFGSTVGYEATDPQRIIDRLNRIYRTRVRLMRCDLVTAALPGASVDVVYCISTIEHLDADALGATMAEVRRILRPGGRLVLTVDLFLDLAPFTSRSVNRYGTNVDVAGIVAQSGLTMVAGQPDQLYGFPAFDADRIQSDLSQYLVGDYPALTQCLVLGG